MNAKEKVVMRLTGRSIYDLINDYYKLESDIVELLAVKPNWGLACNCGEMQDFFQYFEEGSNFAVCITCGGDVDVS